MSKTKKIKKLKDLMSEMSKYLKDAGFIDASQKVQDAMCAMDGAFESESAALDMVTNTPDAQNALPGSLPVEMTGEVAGGMQGAFSIPEAQRLASLSNKLDDLGLYDEADEIDEMLNFDMFEIIDDLEETEDKKKKSRVKGKENKDKAGVGVLVDSNGRVLTDMDQHSGFSGFSDAYFYSGYGNLEGAYGPTDR